jgi:hypothetical protein
MPYYQSLTREKAAVFKSMLCPLMIFFLFPPLFPGDYVFNKNLEIYPLNFTLRIFTLDNHKNIIGRTFKKGNLLYKVVNNGNSLKPVYTFPEPIVGIHVMTNNYLLVSTDRDHWNPQTPCKIYLSKNNGQSFSCIKTLAESGAIWWSMASDRLNNIYVGEYGPKGINQSKRVWKSSDLGKSWKVIFSAPNFEGFENIAGPDKYGYVYTYKYRIKDFSSLPLKNPLPRLPMNNSLVSPVNVKIGWNKVKGVDKYCLVLAEEPGFKKLFLKVDVKEAFFTITLPGNKKFYWKVKSLKKHILTTSWSKVYWFKTSETKTVR